MSLAGCKFIDDCLKFDPNERISWQELTNHVYLESEEYEQTSDDLFVPFNEKLNHSDISKNFYYWALTHRKDSNWLNCCKS